MLVYNSTGAGIYGGVYVYEGIYIWWYIRLPGQHLVQELFSLLLLFYKLVSPLLHKCFQIICIFLHNCKHVVEDIGFPEIYKQAIRCETNNLALCFINPPI